MSQHAFSAPFETMMTRDQKSGEELYVVVNTDIKKKSGNKTEIGIIALSCVLVLLVVVLSFWCWAYIGIAIGLKAWLAYCIAGIIATYELVMGGQAIAKDIKHRKRIREWNEAKELALAQVKERMAKTIK